MTLKWGLLTLISIFWVLGTIGLGIQTYQSTPNNQVMETIKTTFIAFGGLGVILPTYLNIWQSIENNKELEEKINTDIIENTFKLLEQWDTPLLFKARDFTREIKKEYPNLAPNDLVKRIEENPRLERSVLLVFNYFERARISIENGRVDRELFKSLMNEIILDMITPVYICRNISDHIESI
ncbi:DUF4760 domain-containing protein [Leptospira wolffii]|uniref:DUF4760 domain-containing protein n=1 Tax=Leptospira wolffii TaxID=409998 RepID=UPI00108331ED|nr:DUF4760 domain-containing protein [Leptospira wolffii]TGK75814.1 DUF4760 domain-containing protein [Leptospira wolffii]